MRSHSQGRCLTRTCLGSSLVAGGRLHSYCSLLPPFAKIQAMMATYSACNCMTFLLHHKSGVDPTIRPGKQDPLYTDDSSMPHLRKPKSAREAFSSFASKSIRKTPVEAIFLEETWSYRSSPPMRMTIKTAVFQKN